MDSRLHSGRTGPSTHAFRLGAWAFALIGVYLLWTEHRAHLLWVLPWLLLLACPLIHLFMHRRHRSPDSSWGGREDQRPQDPRHQGGRHQEGATP